MMKKFIVIEETIDGLICRDQQDESGRIVVRKPFLLRQSTVRRKDSGIRYESKGPGTRLASVGKYHAIQIIRPRYYKDDEIYACYDTEAGVWVDINADGRVWVPSE